MLFKMQEIQAVLGLLNRLPMTPAEALFTQGFFERLATFCTPPPKPKPEPTTPPPDDTLRETVTLSHDDAQAMADALAIAGALDEADV